MPADDDHPRTARPPGYDPHAWLLMLADRLDPPEDKAVDGQDGQGPPAPNSQPVTDERGR